MRPPAAPPTSTFYADGPRIPTRFVFKLLRAVSHVCPKSGLSLETVESWRPSGWSVVRSVKGQGSSTLMPYHISVSCPPPYRHPCLVVVVVSRVAQSLSEAQAPGPRPAPEPHAPTSQHRKRDYTQRSRHRPSTTRSRRWAKEITRKLHMPPPPLPPLSWQDGTSMPFRTSTPSFSRAAFPCARAPRARPASGNALSHSLEYAYLLLAVTSISMALTPIRSVSLLAS